MNGWKYKRVSAAYQFRILLHAQRLTTNTTRICIISAERENKHKNYSTTLDFLRFLSWCVYNRGFGDEMINRRPLPPLVRRHW